MAKTKTTKIKKLILFDAHAILHRAYHALPEFTSPGGEPTGGLYGLAAMLIRIINDFQPDYLVAAYDLPEPTFRKQLYEAYKAKRPKADEALVAQIKRSRDIFDAFQIPVYAESGFEADDIIGTVAEQLKPEKSLQVIIASGDMDTLQLVDDHRVTVYTLKKGLTDTILYDAKAVTERYGFPPALLVDYKGLRGDPSDNIIGVPGIGEKTATELLQKFGDLESLYAQIKKNKSVLLTKRIKPRIIELLVTHEDEAMFSKTLATIRRDAPIKFILPRQTWREEFDLAKAKKLLSELGFRSLLPRLEALAKSPTAAPAEKPTAPASEPSAISTAAAKPALIGLWLLNSELTGPTLEDLWQFAGAADLTAAKKKVLAELKKQNLLKVYDDIELPLIPIIAAAEDRGVVVDLSYLKQLADKYHRQLAVLEKEIWQLAGREFNVSSPKQLGVILFDELKLTAKGLKKTAGGARSTRESELVKLTDTHPIIVKILGHRELAKLLSTYLDAIPKLVDKQKRLHTHLNQTGTTTGRMSSTEPNLQNIPVHGEIGPEIRRAFVASPGYRLAAFDYSQIELRVLAILSGDPGLVEIFKTGQDVHTAVAARVFNVPPNQVTKDMRRQAKVINFGIIYGMGVTALQANLGTDRAAAQEFYDHYFATFPKVREYFERVKDEAYRRGFTETLFGRRRYLPGLRSKIPPLKAAAERMAMNAPIQGTATGDLTKLAMIRVDKALREAGLAEQVFLLLQIHDELIYEIKTEAVAKAKPLIKKEMEAVLDHAKVPIVVNVSTGQNWGELQ